MTKYYKVVIVKQEGSSVVPEIFMRSGKANPTVPFTVPTTKNNGRSAISTSPPHPSMIEISIGLLHPSFPLILANKINHRYKILFSLSFFLFFFYHSISEPARSCCGLAANPRPPRRTIDELSRFGCV